MPAPASSGMVSLALDTPGILFGAYVCCVGTVASFVLNTVLRNSKLNRTPSVYLVLAAASSLHILFWVSRFFLSHATTIRDHNLSLSSLLELVTFLARDWWSITTIGTLQFWWTENLYIFTHATFTTLLFLKGNGDGITWACTLLARLLGTAPACALFLYSLANQQKSDSRSLTPERTKDADDINTIVPMSQDDPDAPLQLVIPVILALFLISTIPSPAAQEFVPFIVGLHTVSLFPLLLARWNFKTLKIPTLSLYFAVTAICFVMRLQTTMAAFTLDEGTSTLPTFIGRMWSAIETSPAQAATGWDTIYTSICFLCYVALGADVAPRHRSLLPTIAATLALGVGFAAPFSLGNVLDEFVGPAPSQDAEVAEQTG